ncbi:MAG: peptide MFS transporter [Chitinophagaceae bacterium]|jgi:POT family proton-dependent oligopeptide transporter|nr:peptide MFS transporter [Chitinophagaceae bacterium]
MTSTVANQKTSHPAGLYSLFFTEMWERFSYYGMRALLVLYLTSTAMKGGFGLERASALEIYAIFTGLVYLTPILGGILADKLLGQRQSVYIGGLLMALGNFILALSAGVAGAETVAVGREAMLNLGLGLLIAGNGFFKPNISTMVGGLYEQNDIRRDSGFTIFYMGINLGAFLAPLIAGSLGEIYGWQYGFSASGIGMLLGLIIFASTQKYLKNVGLPPSAPATQERLQTKDYLSIAVWTVGVAALVYGMLTLFTSMSDSTYKMVTNTIFAIGALGVIYFIFTNTKGGDEWSRVGVIFVLAFFNIFFWAGFEQAGGTFNLFAEENTNRALGSFTVPTTWFQSINAFGIFTLAPIFAALWIYLSKRKSNPNIPVKFGLGLILLGLGFVVMFFANQKASGGTLVSPLWLVSVYLLHTVGELFLSPIGLSMITKLSPPKIVSLMMGLWFTSIALANYMAGILENLLHKFEMNLFLFLVITSVTGGLIMLAISPFLKKMMRGVS